MGEYDARRVLFARRARFARDSNGVVRQRRVELARWDNELPFEVVRVPRPRFGGDHGALRVVVVDV